jgi:hypothetical protein
LPAIRLLLPDRIDTVSAGRQGVAANRNDTLSPTSGLLLARRQAQKSATPLAPLPTNEFMAGLLLRLFSPRRVNQ